LFPLIPSTKRVLSLHRPLFGMLIPSSDCLISSSLPSLLLGEVTDIHEILIPRCAA
jgi:hypothetical protein